MLPRKNNAKYEPDWCCIWRFLSRNKKLHIALKRQQNESCNICLTVLLEPQLPYLVQNLAGEHLAKFLSLLFSTRPSVLRNYLLPEPTWNPNVWSLGKHHMLTVAVLYQHYPNCFLQPICDPKRLLASIVENWGWGWGPMFTWRREYRLGEERYGQGRKRRKPDSPRNHGNRREDLLQPESWSLQEACSFFSLSQTKGKALWPDSSIFLRSQTSKIVRNGTILVCVSDPKAI